MTQPGDLPPGILTIGPTDVVHEYTQPSLVAWDAPFAIRFLAQFLENLKDPQFLLYDCGTYLDDFVDPGITDDYITVSRDQYVADILKPEMEKITILSFENITTKWCTSADSPKVRRLGTKLRVLLDYFDPEGNPNQAMETWAWELRISQTDDVQLGYEGWQIVYFSFKLGKQGPYRDVDGALDEPLWLFTIERTFPQTTDQYHAICGHSYLNPSVAKAMIAGLRFGNIVFGTDGLAEAHGFPQDYMNMEGYIVVGKAITAGLRFGDILFGTDGVAEAHGHDSMDLADDS
ncbi:hypothetical protein BJ508DRAFT_309386 [Ascobolus immersus RN42]|uniref:Uncharacterized protein n=1 Tax=Ascobolus immersus RN42 TaxID=1160509 RepID=A0A3N4HX70_ASCIM|nr:hypothetical protein BJ508DRAFT_309386 [Ascobolus immersus RN42]